MYAKSFYGSDASMNQQQHSDVNSSESDIDSPAYTPMKGRQPIDYSKFKTNMCRNYMLGLRCPFEDRCAFAHGPIPSRGQAPPPPSYNSTVIGESLCAPPSYSAFVSNESPSDSRPQTPPQYPAKYRYDPYNPQGVVFEN